MLLLMIGAAMAREWIVVVGAAKLPEGLTVESIPHEGSLNLRLTNAGPHTIAIDWNKSVVVNADGESDSLVPGDSRRRQLGGPYAPMLLVGGATSTTWLFRDDRCDGRRKCQDFTGRREFAGFTLDLDVMVDATNSRLRIPFTVVTEDGEPACSVYHKWPCPPK